MSLDVVSASTSSVPKSFRVDLKDPNWLNAMKAECNALVYNNTWDLVHPPHKDNIVTDKWIFRHKLNPTVVSDNTRLVGFFEASLTHQASTLTRRSVRL
jgi:hypothetical protein